MMHNIVEIFAPATQWMLPPVPLLDDEFDNEGGPVDNLGIPAYDHKDELENH